MNSYFLDSGAFSAWSQGVEIDLQKYIKFIHENKHIFDIYACLDVIGDPKKTWENQLEMERQGLQPIITFHVGEDYSWLKKYARKYSFLALGGIAKGHSIREVQKHLDKCWSILTDEKGFPENKVHGFGLTSIKLMRRYPWYSVDSTSWATVSRMGAIIIPRRKKGEWLYDEFSWIVGVTARSPYKEVRAKHYSNLSPKLKEIFLLYLEEKGYSLGKATFINVDEGHKLKQGEENWYDKGKVVERIIDRGVSNDHRLRNEINILYFQDLAETMPEWPWHFEYKNRKGFLR